MNRYASKPLRNSYGAGCLELRAGVFWLVFLLTTYLPGVSNGLLHAGELPPQYAFCDPIFVGSGFGLSRSRSESLEPGQAMHQLSYQWILCPGSPHAFGQLGIFA